MFLWLPINYESINSFSSNLSSEVLQKMVMLMAQTRMLSQSVEMETLDLEKYLWYLCELEFVFCNVQCNIEVVGGCNFSSNVRWAPQGCAGGFLSLLNTLATSSSPCDASKIFRGKPFCKWCKLLLFWTNASLICKIYSLNTFATSFYLSAFWMPKYQNTSLVGFRFIFDNIILPFRRNKEVKHCCAEIKVDPGPHWIGLLRLHKIMM